MQNTNPRQEQGAGQKAQGYPQNNPSQNKGEAMPNRQNDQRTDQQSEGQQPDGAKVKQFNPKKDEKQKYAANREGGQPDEKDPQREPTTADKKWNSN